MPFIILGLLVIVAVVLYLTFANNEGDPALKPNPLVDLLRSIFPGNVADTTAQEGTDANSGDPANAAGNTETTGTHESTAKSGQEGASEEAEFKSMEELTEFYRREAEKLTGIKH